jgi:hypothetical protein
LPRKSSSHWPQHQQWLKMVKTLTWCMRINAKPSKMLPTGSGSISRTTEHGEYLLAFGQEDRSILTSLVISYPH